MASNAPDALFFFAASVLSSIYGPGSYSLTEADAFPRFPSRTPRKTEFRTKTIRNFISLVSFVPVRVQKLQLKMSVAADFHDKRCHNRYRRIWLNSPSAMRMRFCSEPNKSR